jgi:hypothetical protein
LLQPAFSFVLRQRFKDTWSNTNVLPRAYYKRLVEISVHYHERKCETANIQRWRDGLILLHMLEFTPSSSDGISTSTFLSPFGTFAYFR